MKIAVQCKSPLLQKSIELFLEKYLSSLNQCDIVIRDEECLNDERCFFVSGDENADLRKPFSKSQLILALEKKYKELSPVEENPARVEEISYDNEEKLDFTILEERIEQLTQEYKSNILRAVKAFYEN